MIPFDKSPDHGREAAYDKGLFSDERSKTAEHIDRLVFSEKMQKKEQNEEIGS